MVLVKLANGPPHLTHVLLSDPKDPLAAFLKHCLRKRLPGNQPSIYIASAANRSFSGDGMLSVLLPEAPFEHRSVSFPHQSDGTPGRNLRPRTAGCVSDH